MRSPEGRKSSLKATGKLIHRSHAVAILVPGTTETIHAARARTSAAAPRVRHDARPQCRSIGAAPWQPRLAPSDRSFGPIGGGLGFKLRLPQTSVAAQRRQGPKRQQKGGTRAWSEYPPSQGESTYNGFAQALHPDRSGMQGALAERASRLQWV